MARTSNPDWGKIKNEYILTETSLRALARKHKVSPSTIMKKAAEENWTAEKEANNQQVLLKMEALLRARTNEKVAEEMIDAKAAEEVDRLLRIRKAADKLLDALETAMEQLDNYVVTDHIKVKTKRFEFDEDGNKVEVETTKDEEIKSTKKGDIDRVGLRQLTVALRDIVDINNGVNVFGRNSLGEEEAGVVMLSPVEGEDE